MSTFSQKFRGVKRFQLITDLQMFLIVSVQILIALSHVIVSIDPVIGLINLIQLVQQLFELASMGSTVRYS
jgi:hypothetical protein